VTILGFYFSSQNVYFLKLKSVNSFEFIEVAVIL